MSPTNDDLWVPEDTHRRKRDPLHAPYATALHDRVGRKEVFSQHDVVAAMPGLERAVLTPDQLYLLYESQAQDLDFTMEARRTLQQSASLHPYHKSRLFAMLATTTCYNKGSGALPGARRFLQLARLHWKNLTEDVRNESEQLRGELTFAVETICLFGRISECEVDVPVCVMLEGHRDELVKVEMRELLDAMEMK